MFCAQQKIPDNRSLIRSEGKKIPNSRPQPNAEYGTSRENSSSGKHGITLMLEPNGNYITSDRRIDGYWRMHSNFFGRVRRESNPFFAFRSEPLRILTQEDDTLILQFRINCSNSKLSYLRLPISTSLTDPLMLETLRV